MFYSELPTHKFNNAKLTTNFHNLFPEGFYLTAKDRPSASSAMCQRQVALQLTIDKTFVKQPKALNDYARIGNAIEDGVLSRYRKANQLFLSQWKIPEALTSLNFNIGGIIDAFLQIENTLILLDIKSVGSVESEPTISLSSNEVAMLMQGESLLFHPDDNRMKNSVEKGIKEAHVSQLQLYAAVTGFDEVYIQLMSRRVQDKFEFDNTAPTTKFEQIPVDIPTLERRVAIVMYGIECKKKGYIPEPLNGIKKSHCADAFCSFQDFCWKDKSLSLKEDLQHIPEKVGSELKKECIDKAKEYISKRNERYELTLSLITDERNRRLKSKVEL